MDASILSRTAKRHYWTVDEVRQRIAKAKVVIFTKGDAKHPRCGYSQRALKAVSKLGPVEVVNVCDDASIRTALAAFSGHRQLPQVYVDGKFTADGQSFERDNFQLNLPTDLKQ